MKLTDRTQISDVNLTDDCLVHIAKPGTPNTSWKGTVGQLRDAIGGGWTTATLNLTQADCRTLNSANGFYGFKMFDAPGANKVLQIGTPIVHFKRTGGTLDFGSIAVYSLPGGEVLRCYFNQYNNAPENSPFGMISTVGNGNAPEIQIQQFYSLNAALFLFMDEGDSPTYEGTASITVDYRVIDLA